MSRDREPRTELTHEEIGAALAEGAPSEDDRADWAREALARAEEPAGDRPRRLGALLALPAAVVSAAAAIVLLVVLLTPGDEPPVPVNGFPPISPEAIVRQREANEAALRSEAVRDRLAKAPAGSWAGIAKGVFVAIEPSLDALLRKLRGTDQEHRFIFRIGTEGDVTYETTFDYEVVAGMRFLGDAKLTFGSGPGGWSYFREDAREAGTLVAPRLKNDLRPFLPVRVGPPDRAPHPAESVPFLVATGYGGPLILPEGFGWFAFEIPGRAKVTGMGGEGGREFRRHLVRAAIPEIGLDIAVEALGARLDPVKPWTLAGVEWERFRETILAECRKTGDPLLLLVGDASGFWPTKALEAPEVQKALAGYRRAIHLTRWIEPRGLPRGDAPYAQPLELVVYRPHGVFRATSRVTLTDETPVAEVAKALRILPDRGEVPADEVAAPDTIFVEITVGDPAGNAPAVRETEAAQRVLEKRFAGTGVHVAGYVRSWGARILATLPAEGPLSFEDFRKRCESAGTLEFRVLARDGDPTKDGPLDLAKERERFETDEAYRPPTCADADYPGYEWRRLRDRADDGEVRWAPVRIDRWGFTGADLVDLTVALHPAGRSWIVDFGIREERQDAFGLFTGTNSDDALGEGQGRRVAIILDGEIVTAPALRAKLTKRGYIEGNFTKEEAENLMAVLGAPPLPVRLRITQRSDQRKGELHGRHVRWHLDGRKAEEGAYRDGKKVGTWRKWHPDGSLAEKIEHR